MRGMDLSGMPVTVLGAGRTGLATARFLSERGARVLVSERASISISTQKDLAQLGVPFEEGGHSERALEADLIIPSPGIPEGAPILEAARARGVPIMGELELAYRFCPSKNIMAITGTVGKTTTTHLIAELLQTHGHRVITAGNIGPPFIARVKEIDEETIVVLEVSSFQLEQVRTFRPHVGVLTRLGPHHLDRHKTVERYFETKCRLFARQSERDYAVFHAESPPPPALRSRVLRYSAEDLLDFDPELNGDLAPHQRENLAGALCAARLLDPAISPECLDLKRAFHLPHRLELVTEIEGVRFYNDSKATSPAATQAALRAFEGVPLALILAGRADLEDLDELAETIRRQNVQAVFLLGGARTPWARRLRALGYTRFRLVRGMEQAIEGALEAKPRVCLFSPGAASFDQFKNYEERGERFKAALFLYRSSGSQTGITPSSDQVSARP